MYKNQCSRTLSIKILTDSEHIPPPILQVKAFQIFLSSIFTSLSPSIAFTQKQNQKARHSCRAQNSQKQTRAQLSCLLLSPLSFPFQPSAKPFGNFPLYFHCFAEYWEIQKSPKYFHLSSQWSISQWAHRALREVSLAMRRGWLHYSVLGLMVDQHAGPPLAYAQCGWIIEHFKVN